MGDSRDGFTITDDGYRLGSYPKVKPHKMTLEEALTAARNICYADNYGRSASEEDVLALIVTIYLGEA